MDKHINIIAYLHVVYGVLLLVVAAIVGLSMTGGGLLADDPALGGLLSGVGVGVALLIALLALPLLAAGFGLLRRRPWARTLAIVLSILNLFSFPVGTALAVYALWVLFQDETKAEFAPHDAYRP